MALLHHADLDPTKSELLATWLPSQPWAADLSELRRIGGYRINDPDGEVGMEGILLRNADGVVVHVPLSYRGAPLEDAADHLVGTTEHSVLGTRWVYDATADPVWQAAVSATIASGGSGAEEYFEEDGERMTRTPSVTVRGSGGDAAGREVSVVHLPGSAVPDGPSLAGSWAGGSGILVVLSAAAG